MPTRALLRRPVFAAASLLALTAGCEGSRGPSAASQPAHPVVAVSVAPQAWVVDRLAGELVSVVVMVPPGASPDTYEPTVDQVGAFSRALLYIKVGHPNLPFERAWLGQLVAGNRAVEVVDGALGLELTEGDPHTWLSPATVMVMADRTAAALTRLLPERAAVIEERRVGLQAELAALDRELADILRNARGERFVVQHPAWGYLADRYGLVQVAIERHGSHTDLHSLNDAIAEARRAHAKVIFVQPQVDPHAAGVVAREVGARVETIDPLAPDWSANLVRSARSIAAAIAAAAEPAAADPAGRTGQGGVE